MKTYEQPSFSINTERKHADVVTGATLTITLEDARAMLAMTSLSHLHNTARDEDSEDVHKAYCEIAETSRKFVRNIAKRILYNEGETNEVAYMISKFTNRNHEAETKEILAKSSKMNFND